MSIAVTPRPAAPVLPHCPAATALHHSAAQPPRQSWRRLVTVAAGALALAGCTQFPDMAGRLSDADTKQGYPALVPAEGLLAGTQDLSIAPETQTSLENRVTALQGRADALRATQLDTDTRARMQRGVTAQQP